MGKKVGIYKAFGSSPGRYMATISFDTRCLPLKGISNRRAARKYSRATSTVTSVCSRKYSSATASSVSISFETTTLPFASRTRGYRKSSLFRINPCLVKYLLGSRSTTSVPIARQYFVIVSSSPPFLMNDNRTSDFCRDAGTSRYYLGKIQTRSPIHQHQANDHPTHPCHENNEILFFLTRFFLSKYIPSQQTQCEEAVVPRFLNPESTLYCSSLLLP